MVTLFLIRTRTPGFLFEGMEGEEGECSRGSEGVLGAC